MNRPLLTAFFFCCFLSFAQSDPDTAAPLRPHDPVLPRAATPASWTISYDYSSTPFGTSNPQPASPPTDQRNQSGSLLTTVVEKFSRGYHESHTYRVNSASEFWLWRGTPLFSPGEQALVIQLPQMTDLNSDYSQSDFEIVQWVGQDNFVGVVSFLGRKAFLFRVKRNDKRKTSREILEEQAMKAANVAPPNYGDQVISAWLDCATQLPIAYEQSDMRLTYIFNPPPAPNITPPAKFQHVLDLLAKKDEIKSRHLYTAP